jgi:hypothetical protein
MKRKNIYFVSKDSWTTQDTLLYKEFISEPCHPVNSTLPQNTNNIFNDEKEQACLKLSEGVEDSFVKWEGCWPRTLFLCNLVIDPMERKQL